MNKDNHLIYEAYTVQEEGLKDIIKGAGAAAAIGLGSMATGDEFPRLGGSNLTAYKVRKYSAELGRIIYNRFMKQNAIENFED